MDLFFLANTALTPETTVPQVPLEIDPADVAVAGENLGKPRTAHDSASIPSLGIKL